MSEPEELITEAAHRGVVHAALLHRRWSGSEPPAPALDPVRRRLELFVAALCGAAPPIGTAEPESVPTWLARLTHRSPPSRISFKAIPSTDGIRIRLPQRLYGESGCADLPVLEVYRVLALGQAIRTERGGPHRLSRLSGALANDCFEVAEAASSEARIESLAPGLVPVLSVLRARMLAQRPVWKALHASEQRVEELVRRVLRGDSEAPVFETSAESLDWALQMAATIPGGDYRGMAPVFSWGRMVPAPIAPADALLTTRTPVEEESRTVRSAPLSRAPRRREAVPGEDQPQAYPAMIPTEDRQESVEDPMGLARPVDREEAPDPADLADSLSELPEARLVSTPGRPREILHGDNPMPVRVQVVPPPRRAGEGYVYPEWDMAIQGYRPMGATVRLRPPSPGSQAWVSATLARHAPLVRAVRRRFERLRVRRVHLSRQVSGSEPDIDAYVEAHADLRSGHPVDDRLYLATRPLRRECSIMLLVDASASTDSWVDSRARVIDVEKEALLLVCEALEALGDRYGVLAFSGEGPENVRISPLRTFDESRASTVRQHIAGLEPDGYTRLGAALRHASTLLREEHSRHRLLVVLSDGKPNDVDAYEGAYGVEDARRAVLEARADGLAVFCLTVDREAARYLPHIFGPTGFTVLRHVSGLSLALLQFLRRVVMS